MIERNDRGAGIDSMAKGLHLRSGNHGIDRKALKRMKSLFNMDSPLMQELEKLANLMYLNVLTLICCIPIVTAGAALVALHSVCLRMVRHEEGYLTKDFFKAFKENFRQATVIWLLLLLGIAVVTADFLIMYYSVWNFPVIVRVGVLIVALLILGTAMYVFPMLAKFENTVWGTIKNAAKASLIQFPKTLLMIFLLLLEPFLVAIFGWTAALVFLYGFSVHAYLSALLYNKFFARLEEMGAKKEDSAPLL